MFVSESMEESLIVVWVGAWIPTRSLNTHIHTYTYTHTHTHSQNRRRSIKKPQTRYTHTHTQVSDKTCPHIIYIPVCVCVYVLTDPREEALGEDGEGSDELHGEGEGEVLVGAFGQSVGVCVYVCVYVCVRVVMSWTGRKRRRRKEKRLS